MGLFRVFLALCVVGAHVTLPRGVKLMSGADAVRCFYIVSGFYMALVLSRKYSGPGRLKDFWLSRFFRLWPAYACVVLLTVLSALVLPLWGRQAGLTVAWEEVSGQLSWGWKTFFAGVNLTLFGSDTVHFFRIDPVTQVIFGTHNAPPNAIEGRIFLVVPPAWTLGVELWFYLFAPFLVRRPLWLLLGLTIVSLVAKAWTWQAGLNVTPWDSRFFPFELSLFLAGVMAYRLYEHCEITFDRHPGLVGTAGIFLLALVVIYPFVGWPRWEGLSLFYVVMAALQPALFHFTKRNAFDRWFGEFSYLIYITHLFLASTVVALMANPFTRITVFGLALAAVCWLLHKYIEEPVTAWRAQRFGT